MSNNTVKTGVDGHIGTITLNRPEAMNTFTRQLAVDLEAALEDLEADDDVRAIIVEGAGEAFSAGIELAEHDEFETEAEYERWVSGMETPFLTLANMGTPVIAAAHGFAVANGLGLLAACDLAVVTEGTQLGATAPKVGLFCMGPAVPIMRSVTEKRCLELLLTGELIDADTAHEWGLVNRVVPEDELREEALELARSITEKSPTAVQAGKKAYYRMAGMGYEDGLEYSNQQFASLCTTREASEGIDAFLSGRDPDWQTE